MSLHSWIGLSLGEWQYLSRPAFALGNSLPKFEKAGGFEFGMDSDFGQVISGSSEGIESCSRKGLNPLL
jgi:hypothetical protein